MKWFRALLFAIPLTAFGQLQLSIFDGTAEKAVGGTADLGSIQAGDSKEIRFHAANTTNAPISLDHIRVSGSGFTLSGPDLPFVVAVSKYVEFRVKFSATTVASYSAFLNVNDTQVLLRMSVIAGPTVSLVDDQVEALLTAGATIDFGRVQKGHSAARQFRIANGNSTPLTLASCSVSGTGFSADGLACPASLNPGEAITATITFAPATPTAQTGAVTIDNRTFLLSGIGFVPPLPPPSIGFDSMLTSGIQKKLAIRFASAAESSDTGTVTLDFQAASTAFGDDPAIRFTASGARALSFKVNEGDSTATFPAGVDTTFQTGTTAGTITFHVKIGDNTTDFAFPIAQSGISIDSASGVRRAGALDISVIGFDNTRSAGRMSFTFYDAAGRMIQPGAVRTDWTDAFTSYFRGSKVGGSFVLRATFPVTGDASLIGGVEVEVTNAVSTTRTTRLTF